MKSLGEHSDDMIKPGVFKARYGTHGDELILLTQLKFKNVLLGSKLTGDRNVPCGKHSFVIDLSDPLLLDLSQQDDLESLLEVETSATGTCEQPFIVPAGVNIHDDRRATEKLLSTRSCMARYSGEATLAYDCFDKAWWSKVHWIKFDENTFAVMFFELSHISLFTRQSDTLF